MSLGAPEIIGIIVLALLLFGSRKLPELGSSVGKTITNFKKGISEATEDEEATTATTTAPPAPHASIPQSTEAADKN